MYAGMQTGSKRKEKKKKSKMHAGRKREGSTIRPGRWWFLKRSLLEARKKKKSFDSRQQTADSQTVSENGA